MRGVYFTGEGAEELDEFLRLAKLCVERYLGPDEKPQLSWDDLAQDERLAKKALRLLDGEDYFLGGGDVNVGPGWKAEISRRCRDFIGLTTIESYLALEEESAPQRISSAADLSAVSMLIAPTPTTDSPASDLLRALLPEDTAREILPALHSAEQRFLQPGATDEDRRHAVRDLAGLLERVRNDLQRVLPTGKDDDALFQIANNFYIRHNNEQQRKDYDPLWLAWVFRLYQSTLYAYLGLLAKRQQQ